jgi:hypothetical protein
LIFSKKIACFTTVTFNFLTLSNIIFLFKKTFYLKDINVKKIDSKTPKARDLFQPKGGILP